MAFVRTKRVNGKSYRQLVENYRDEDGRHRQRVLAHLGPGPAVGTTEEELGRAIKDAKFTERVVTKKLRFVRDAVRRYEETLERHPESPVLREEILPGAQAELATLERKLNEVQTRLAKLGSLVTTS